MDLTGQEREKKLAAEASVAFVKNGMTVGLGTGSTSTYMLYKLGEAVAKGLSIQGVPSSENTARLAAELGIPLTTLNDVGTLDVNIDGADEFDPEFRLIKGGGGALLREKIIAHNSRLNVIISDSGKQVEALGKFKLPLETIPFATPSILKQLDEMGLRPVLRSPNGKPFRTDENNYIVDVDILGNKDIDPLNHTLIHIPGVVETGLFLESTDIIIMGKGTETVLFERSKK